jgi:flagellar protein FlaF
MRRAARAGRKAFPDLVAALHDNRRLWTILAVEVADEANALPRDLRARIFYLAEFIAQHTPKVLTREAGAEALIEINTAIMRGLRGQTGGS